MAVANTIIGATQPVLTRYAAVRLDPILFLRGGHHYRGDVRAADSLSAAANCAMLFDRRYSRWLIAMSMTGTVMTSLTLIYGMQHIDAIAAVILLETEPVYSLILSVVVVGERPSPRQLLATAAILSRDRIGVLFRQRIRADVRRNAGVRHPFFWQTSHVLGLRVMPPLTPVTVAGARFIFAACVFIPMFLLRPGASLAPLRDPSMLAVIWRDRLLRVFPVRADLVWRNQPALAVVD